MACSKVVHVSLQDHQFGKYAIARQESDDDDNYVLFKEDTTSRGERGFRAAGSLSVVKQAAHSQTRYPAQPDYFGGSTANSEKMGEHDAHWYDHLHTLQHDMPHRSQVPTDRPEGQGMLFTHQHRPAKSVVDTLIINHEEDRVQGMTLLGVAQNNAKSRGTALSSPSDLSEHSSKLVRSLKDKGAVAQDAVDDQSNTISFSTMKGIPDVNPLKGYAYGGYRPVPVSEVKAGR
jgi:hypothetical protein